MYMGTQDPLLDLSLTSHCYEGESVTAVSRFVGIKLVLKSDLCALCCRDYAEDAHALHTLYYLGLTMLAR
jgi:hypothetical protein